MENQKNNPQEEIENIEQFQINRSLGNVADGKDTPLNEGIEGPDDDEDEEDGEAETKNYNESDIEEMGKDPDAYDKDDSEML